MLKRPSLNFVAELLIPSCPEILAQASRSTNTHLRSLGSASCADVRAEMRK